MGASGWDYYVPFEPDLNSALRALKEQVLANGEYHWPLEADLLPAEFREPRPRTLTELDALLEGNEILQSDGTHSILDMERVIAPGEDAEEGTIEPVSAADARELTGRERLTRADVEAIWDLADERWFGRCAVLHDDRGEPAEILFWGFSGD
jgi:hypothetical protein